MPGWTSSACSGRGTWMRSSATWTAWSQQRRRKRSQKESNAAKTVIATKEQRHENQGDHAVRGRPGKGLAFLYRGAGLCKKERLQSGSVSLADRCLARGAERHRAAVGAEQQPRGQGLSASNISTESARYHVLHGRYQGRLRADQGARSRVHDVADRCDWLDDCDAERHLRQPGAAYPTSAVVGRPFQ